jgi:hypothetical protein
MSFGSFSSISERDIGIDRPTAKKFDNHHVDHPTYFPSNKKHPPASLGPMLFALKLLTLVGPPNWNRSEKLVFPGPSPHSKPERAATDIDCVVYL